MVSVVMNAEAIEKTLEVGYGLVCAPLVGESRDSPREGGRTTL